MNAHGAIRCLLPAALLWLRIIAPMILVVPTLRAPIVRAQPEQPRFERLGVENGLSSNSVISLLQDHQGFIWIGTLDGLNRYDGYTFEVYRHDPSDPHSLPHNAVRVLIEDRQRRLWVGTDNGLSRLDRRTGQFVRSRFADEDAAAGPQDVTALLDFDEETLFAVMNGILYRYEPDTDRFVRERIPDPDAPENDLFRHGGGSAIHLTEDGRLWVVHDNFLIAYSPHDGSAASVRMPARFNGRCIYEDELGRVWVFQYRGGFGFDTRSGEWSVLEPEFEGAKIFDVAIGRMGADVWFARGEGADALSRLNPVTGAIYSIRTDPDIHATLANLASSLLVDSAGSLWVGTMSGLFRSDPYVQPFTHLGADPRRPELWIDNPVMAIAPDTTNALWLGTYGAGLIRLDLSAATRYDDFDNPCGKLVWAVHVDGPGRVWIGSEAGLCSLDVATGRFSLKNQPGIGGPPRVNALVEDPEGNIWVGSARGALRLEAGRRTVDRYLPAAEVGEVVAMLVDADGRIWLSSTGGRLHRVDPETMTFETFSLSQIATEQGFWTIGAADSSRLWLGSDQGLTLFDVDRGALAHYTRRDGLAGTIVFAIVPGGGGVLWLSTNLGLTRFDPATGEMRSFGAGDGLHSIEFNRRAAAVVGSTLLFGDLQGITRFEPTSLRTNDLPPPVVLTTINVSNREASRTLPSFGLDRLDLTYRDYSLAFTFSALNFTDPSRNQYAYTLEGFDRDWIHAGTRRFASYTNLPAGRYTFRVKGANNDGVWNESGIALPIVVAPPFWETWWFGSAISLFVVAVLAALYRYRVAHIRRMERMRLRIASDLHDDIGSRLSSIALMSEMVRDRTELPAFEAMQLTRVGRTAREMVSALRDIIWFIDPEHDATGDLVAHMRETATSLLNGVEFTLEAAALPNHLPLALRRHLFLIYKEALHNVTRHARAHCVSVALTTEGSALTMSIHDDGEGFACVADRPGYGLGTMRRRAEHLGGSLHVDSAPGSGTTVLVTAPLTYENT